MSADVIQFVPRPNPKRDLVVAQHEAAAAGRWGDALKFQNERAALEFNAALPVWPDFSSAGRFHAPDGDCA